MSQIVYVSIGNSDGKLTQSEWAEFQADVDRAIDQAPDDLHVHGRWFSLPNTPWQSACWCVEIGLRHGARRELRERLRDLVDKYRQDSIAWIRADTELLKGRL